MATPLLPVIPVVRSHLASGQGCNVYSLHKLGFLSRIEGFASKVQRLSVTTYVWVMTAAKMLAEPLAQSRSRRSAAIPRDEDTARQLPNLVKAECVRSGAPLRQWI